ncbi:1-phosphofructokinase family hexose kinase [Streptomyces marispadix]|uniref:1-phosphofructokinase family hexose kinase n=1 Tax=Streptomyces marispadix TaxID=2922868 RepID=A0ABS9SWZ1_9ACTN|nr:1-phosphofructokinase family hexose kinase [Streptomyces marispadix]MCH6160799.1 1-phosphofructokinase family hexose kinase [Streptomyces marispadix]
MSTGTGAGTGTAVGRPAAGGHGRTPGTVVTVTPNPSLDRTYEIAGLARGAVLRADADRVDPGGKGVNVSRALAAAGLATVAVLPLGGPEGALLARLLERRGIEVAGVPVRESTRVNISLAEPDGSLTKINAPGPEISPEEAEALLEAAGERAAGAGAVAEAGRGADAEAGHGADAEAGHGGAAESGSGAGTGRAGRGPAAGASWIVCSGSLPRGLAPAWYAGLVARAHRQGVRIALDTSGPALSAALRERPDVVKPNAHELAEAVGRPLATVGDAVKAAEDLRGAGAGTVLASLGATGQLLVDATGTYFGSAAPVPVRSDVGAGDASLAGFLGAGGAGPQALASAVAHGLAAVQLPGSEMPCPADLRPGEVTVTAEPPLDHPLGRPLSRPLSDSANGAV